MALLLAVLAGVFSILCFKGGRKGLGFTFGLIGILTCVYWLQTGPGFAVLDWLDNPTGPEIPDSVPIPGRE